jgi:uncharacterized repeat protein (TIGR04076 family)
MAKRKIFGTIKSVKGTCGWGHKTGDTFEISTRDTAGTCGWLYHTAFPNLCIMQSGGNIWEEGTKEKTIVMSCPDRTNEVVIELKLVEQ